jgi:hypothetical protein
VENRYNTNTNITIHACKYIQNKFPNVGLLEEKRGGGKEEENDTERIIVKYITSV